MEKARENLAAMPLDVRKAFGFPMTQLIVVLRLCLDNARHSLAAL
jgi:hypothetical protein